MKKFTLLYLNDSDKSHGNRNLSQDVQTDNDVGQLKTTEFLIIMKDLQKQTSLKVIGDATVADMKRKLIQTFGSLLYDSQNMGIYQPDEDGRKGKFLEEERLLSEYFGSKTSIRLEFVYKRRLIGIPSVAAHLLSKSSKNFVKVFLRHVSRGDCQKIEKILAKGFDPNFQCPKTGETPLTIAVTRSKPQAMITTLIAGGAHRDFYSRSGFTPLHKAAAVCNFEGVKTLLDFGQSPNCLDKSGLTPLYYNILCDPDTRISRSLLYEHSVLGITDGEGLQEIHQAARYNRVDQINLLLMYGADVNARCMPTKQPISSNLVTIRSRSCRGDTPLHIAAAASQRAAVLRLLSWGADPTLVNTENNTPIQIASMNGNTELADLIRFFRGRNENNDVFLPAPTYNPRRRVRRSPPESHITEPTALQQYLLEVDGSIAPIDRKLHILMQDSVQLTSDATQNYQSKAGTCVCSVQRDSSNDQRPVQRAISLGNLVQPAATDITNRWDNMWDLAPSGPYSPTSDPPGPREGLDKSKEVVINTCGTLTHPNRSVTTQKGPTNRTDLPNDKQNAFHLSPLDRYHPQSDSVFSHPVIKPSLYLLGKDDDGLKSNDLTSKDFHPKPFQREGSQADSGISNSSCSDKRTPKLMTNWKQMGKIGQNLDNNIQKGFQNEDNMTISLRSESVSPNVGQTNYLVPGFHQSSQQEQQQDEQPKTNHLPRVEPSRQARSGIQTAHDNFKTSSNNETNVPDKSDHNWVGENLPRTVVLCKPVADLSSDKESRPSFGLSIRTVKHTSALNDFHPTMVKPSLQSVKRVTADSPADKAGVRVGDFILKINGVDVTGASLEQVVNLLSNISGGIVSLTLLTPASPPKFGDAAKELTKLRSTSTTKPNNEISKSTITKKSNGNGNLTSTTRSTSIGEIKLPDANIPAQASKTIPQSMFSPTSSGRSSGRTNNSSVTGSSSTTSGVVDLSTRSPASVPVDEGIWSQCDSPNMSGRSCTSPKPSVSLLKGCQSPGILHRGAKSSKTDPQSHRVRFRGLPRSQTISGMSEVSSGLSEQSMANSLYFPRNPRFQRVGSGESESSVSSSGIGMSIRRSTDLPCLNKINANSHQSLPYEETNINTLPTQRGQTFLQKQRVTAMAPYNQISTVRRPASLHPDNTTPTQTLLKQTAQKVHYRFMPKLNSKQNSPTNSELILPPPAEFSN